MPLTKHYMPNACFANRTAGKTFPDSFFALKAVCRSDTITIGQFGTYEISKSTASMLVIACDVLCSYSFYIAIFLLKMF